MPVFRTPDFERELRAVLLAGDPERALATAARIVDGDPDSWLREWTASGGEARAEASYLHAAACYGAALMLIADTDGSVDERALWERQRECWDAPRSGSGASAWRSRTRPPRCRGTSSPHRPIPGLCW
jgi:hypothetical protein